METTRITTAEIATGDKVRIQFVGRDGTDTTRRAVYVKVEKIHNIGGTGVVVSGPMFKASDPAAISHRRHVGSVTDSHYIIDRY